MSNVQEQYDELEKLALESVKSSLKAGGDMDDTEKAAVKVLGIQAKRLQTHNRREALTFSMMAMIGTPAELKSYIRATNPLAVKKLTAPK